MAETLETESCSHEVSVSSPRRAVIVEDDPGIRTLAAHLLRRDGFRVDEFANGREALARLLDDQGFDIVVLDLAMREMNGLEVIDYLRSRSPQALQHVLVITANVHAMRRPLPEGVCHLLLKPFELCEFLTAVRGCARPAAEA